MAPSWPITFVEAGLETRLYGLRELLTDHVRRVSVVLFADALDQIDVGLQVPGQFDVPRFRVCLGIVDGHVDVDAADRWTRVAFDDFERIGSWQAAHVEPRSAVLPDGLDDERVARPAADGASN